MVRLQSVLLPNRRLPSNFLLVINPNSPQRPTLRVGSPKGEKPAPVPVNFFNMSFFGTEVQVDASYMDIHELAVAIGPESKNRQITPALAVRMTMSIQGFALMRAQIEMIATAMKGAGINLDAAATAHPVNP